MRHVLMALKGARLIAEGSDGDRKVYHYLLPSGVVLEVVM